MGLKILHSADWHLDSPFGGFSEPQRQLLREQQKLLPGKIADLCRRENCDLVLLAGDLFDGQPNQDTVDILKEALARCGAPVLIAPGQMPTLPLGRLLMTCMPQTESMWYRASVSIMA